MPPVASGLREVQRSQELPRLVQLAFRHLPSRSESTQAAMPFIRHSCCAPARNDIDRHAIATRQFWRSSALARCLPGLAQGSARGLRSRTHTPVPRSIAMRLPHEAETLAAARQAFARAAAPSRRELRLYGERASATRS